jgi:hypothetical protein
MHPSPGQLHKPYTVTVVKDHTHALTRMDVDAATHPRTASQSVTGTAKVDYMSGQAHCALWQKAQSLNLASEEMGGTNHA